MYALIEIKDTTRAECCLEPEIKGGIDVMSVTVCPTYKECKTRAKEFISQEIEEALERGDEVTASLATSLYVKVEGKENYTMRYKIQLIDNLPRAGRLTVVFD